MTQLAVQIFHCPVHGPVTKQTTRDEIWSTSPTTYKRVCLMAVDHWYVEDDGSQVDTFQECERPVSGPHVLASMTKPEE